MSKKLNEVLYSRIKLFGYRQLSIFRQHFVAILHENVQSDGNVFVDVISRPKSDLIDLKQTALNEKEIYFSTQKLSS